MSEAVQSLHWIVHSETKAMLLVDDSVRVPPNGAVAVLIGSHADWVCQDTVLTEQATKITQKYS